MAPSALAGSTAPAAATWPRYRLYGVTMASDFRFANRLAAGDGPPDLTFTRIFEAPPRADLRGRAPAYASATRPGRDEPALRIYTPDGDGSGGRLVVSFTASADYHLFPDRIVCHLLDPAYDYLAEIQFLGYVLSIWLESRAVPALHASAVVAGGHAIAFLASNRGGKSSLAASLMQAGCPLLTDDILPLERAAGGIIGRPGYPQMRMWPEEAAHFLGRYQDLDIVHPAFTKRRIPVGPGGLGAFHDQPVRLGRLYVPEMRDDGCPRVETEPLSPREVLAQLLRNSFAGAMVEALGWQRRRLHTLAQTAGMVPAHRLRYPRGMDLLPQVRREILAACAGLDG